MEETKSQRSVTGLLDVQGQRDVRGISIDEVGVTELTWPIVVLDQAQGKQSTVAKVEMAVGLPHRFKGTHLSRFIEVLNAHRGELTVRTLPDLLTELKTRLNARTARIQVRFPYFLERTAPVSGAKSLLDYECSFTATSNGRHGEFALAVRVPVTSLCPCSKAISDYGAHNQRAYLLIEVRPRRESDGSTALIWLEELIAIGEGAGSAPLYPLLKRADERFVTMQAYDRPVFVEDMVRNVAVALRRDDRVSGYMVHATSQESIHNHNAYARLEWSRPRANGSRGTT